MRASRLALLLPLGAALACTEAYTVVRGTGPTGRELRSVAAFTSVAADGPLDVTVRVGGPQAVWVQGHADLLEYVRCEVDDGALRIRVEPGLRLMPPPDVEVSVPALTRLALSGSGTLRAAAVEGTALDASISGSGDLHLAGVVGRFSLSMAGSGDVHAAELEAQAATVSKAGSGVAWVRVAQSLEVDLVGSGDVIYAGEPEHVERTILGSGSVRSGAEP